MKTKFRLMAFICMLAMLATTSFTSCGDDDDDEGGSVNAEDLIGTWQEYSEEAWWDYGDGEEGHELEIYDNEEQYYCYTTFNADGTWTERWREKGKQPTERIHSGTWSLKGNTLIWDGDDDEEEANIISINGNTLTITNEYREDGEWEKEVLTYKKVSK